SLRFCHEVRISNAFFPRSELSWRCEELHEVWIVVLQTSETAVGGDPDSRRVRSRGSGERGQASESKGMEAANVIQFGKLARKRAGGFPDHRIGRGPAHPARR